MHEYKHSPTCFIERLNELASILAQDAKINGWPPNDTKFSF